MSTKPKVYFDTGALSVFRKSTTLQDVGRMAYSEALMLDLKNSTDAAPEIEFLQKCQANFLYETGGQVRMAERDAWEVFAETDDCGLPAIASMAAFLHGGGPNATFLQGLSDFLAKAFGAPDAALLEEALRNANSSLETHTNRDVESSLDRIPKSVSRTRSLRAISHSLGDTDRMSFQRIFPVAPPGIDGIAVAALALGMMGLGRTKGIRSRNQHIATKTGRHDYLDALHIAYGMHCDLFVTNDKGAAAKFTVLRDYWSGAAQVRLLVRVTSSESIPH